MKDFSFNTLLQRGFSILFIACLLLLASTMPAHAQRGASDAAKARQYSLDSAREARTAKLEADKIERIRVLDSAKTARTFTIDSTRNALKEKLEREKIVRERMLDSSREARQTQLAEAKADRDRVLDSTRAVRRAFTDSLQDIRDYRSSRTYKDSVKDARDERLAEMRSKIKQRTDSIRAEQRRTLDSAAAVRNAALAERKAILKTRSDSLAVIRKYRNSRRYSDSVKVVKQARVDSIRQKRETFLDSSRLARKTMLDAQKAERTRVLDSAKAGRKIFLDSLTAMRKVRADSLSAMRLEREKLREVQQKQKEAKIKLALEIKIKSKREAWNNEKMLKKRFGFPRRPIQNLFTHYNYYFNANRKMEEAQRNMERLARDDYSGPPLRLFTFNPDQDSTKLASDMDSVIQKASLGIQIHDPRVKWADDLYLLLGQAYYYKGNYEQALTAFKYVISLRDRYKTNKEKNAARSKSRKSKEPPSFVEKEPDGFLGSLKHQTSHNRGLLWMARTYTQTRKFDEAEAILDVLQNDANFPEGLAGELALEKAFLALEKGNKRDAVTQLAIVSADKGTEQLMRRRTAFLAGQMMQEQSNYKAAAEQYDQVLDLHPKLAMDFYARKNRAFNELKSGGDAEQTLSGFKKLLRDNKYAAYHEQIYYILGQAAANSGNEAEAVEYLTKGTQSTNATGKQKAVSYASLGNLYFNKGNYTAAKFAYDSAAHYANAAADDSAVAIAVSRGRVLDGLAIPSTLLRDSDSLLNLASLSEKEQRQTVRRYIKTLASARQDSINRAQAPAVATLIPNSGGPSGGAAQDWYFSNPVQMQQGLNDFKRKWGNRQNSDNWRRAGAGNNDVIKNNTAPIANAPTASGGVELDEDGLPTEKYLLSLIPNDPAQQRKITAAMERAYVDLATSYIQDFDEYKLGDSTLGNLDRRYQNHKYKDEATYLRYLIALRQGRLADAKGIAANMSLEFPDSKFTSKMNPAETQAVLDASKQEGSTASIYQEAYNLVQNRQYDFAIAQVNMAEARNDRQYSGRLTIVKSMALAGKTNYGAADTLLTKFLSNQPNDSLKTWAQNVQDFVKRNRLLQASRNDSIRKAQEVNKPTTQSNPAPRNNGTPTTSTIDSSGIPPTTTVDSAGAPVTPINTGGTFTYNKNEGHAFVFAFGAMESRVMGVKAGLGDFNNIKFSSQNLVSYVEAISSAQGLLITKGFKTEAEAKKYLREFQSTNLLTREFQAREYKLFLISNSNLQKLLAQKDLNSYLNFYQAKYR